MIEAMACGTPVIAFRQGSVPEIIEDGVSGFIVENEAEAADRIARIHQLDRRGVRAAFERRFTARRMAEEYVHHYNRLRIMMEALVKSEGFAVDASLIQADANKHRSIPGAEWHNDIDPEQARRAVKEYLATLDAPAYGAASDVTPKFVSPSDPAAQWTGALRNAAFFAYANNYLVDVKFGIIMDVEASRAIRQAEVCAAQTMIERTEACFGIRPKWLAADSAYGSASNLDWLINEQGIAPHVPVIDKSQREDGTFSREDFSYDQANDVYICPGGKTLTTTGTRVNYGDTLLYRASKADCDACVLRSRCCPNTPARKVPRSIHEHARDMAREIGKSWEGRVSRRLRKKIEMLFAHLKRILKLDRLRLRGPNGAHDEFLLAATAQNLRKLAKLIPIPSPQPA